MARCLTSAQRWELWRSSCTRWSLKKRLSFSNLREAFFQAVSNSSWANEGYLVAADISTDEDFQAELHRLSASFGIAIIQLDIEQPIIRRACSCAGARYIGLGCSKQISDEQRRAGHP